MKVKNVSGAALSCEWVPGGEVDDGTVVEVPDAQPDGSLLHWPPEYFEVVTDKPKAAAKAKAEAAE